MIKNYIASWPDFDYRNFRLLLDDVTEKFGDNIALYMSSEAGHSAYLDSVERHPKGYLIWRYEALGGTIRHLARCLINFGIGPADRVAIVSENRAEWIIVFFAAVISRRVVVPIDANASADDIKTILSQSGVRLLFASEKLLSKVSTILGTEESAVEEIICFDDLSTPDNSISFSSIMEKQWEATLPDPKQIDANDTASIIYTSGTTGFAKGVVLSQNGIIANANASILSLPIYEDDVFVGVLPFHHTYPTTCSIVSPLMVGGGIAIVDKVVGNVIIEMVKDTGGSILIGVPLLFDKLCHGIARKLEELAFPVRALLAIMRGFSHAVNTVLHKNPGKILFKGLREKAGLSSLRLMVSGGGPLSTETAAFFQSLGFEIRQGYGMSENGPLIATNTLKHYNNRSVGLPVKYTDIRIAEPDEHGVGEIQVTSPSLMKGYFNNPKATEEAITEDGYLRTGDLGYIDAQGFLYITGRKKNLIVTSGGKNVYPEEIEHYFEGLPFIAEVLVLGERVKGPNDERVKAILYPDYEALHAEYGEEAITVETVHRLMEENVRRVNAKLPGYKKVDSWMIREEEFSKTSSQKIKRYLYKEPGTR